MERHQILHLVCICVYFLLLISQFALKKRLPANSGMLSTWCADRFCLLSAIMSSLVAFVMHPSVFGCMGWSFVPYMIFRQVPFLCNRRQTAIHGSTATITSRGANFPFFLFLHGSFVVDVRSAWRKPDRRVYFTFMAASLIKGTKQHAA